MKIYMEKSITQQALDEIRCNKCGRQLEKDKFGYFEDHLAVEKSWGYNSPADGECHRFDLCYECYLQMVSDFVIEPHKSYAFQ